MRHDEDIRAFSRHHFGDDTSGDFRLPKNRTHDDFEYTIHSIMDIANIPETSILKMHQKAKRALLMGGLLGKYLGEEESLKKPKYPENVAKIVDEMGKRHHNERFALHKAAYDEPNGEYENSHANEIEDAYNSASIFDHSHPVIKSALKNGTFHKLKESNSRIYFEYEPNNEETLEHTIVGKTI